MPSLLSVSGTWHGTPFPQMEHPISCPTWILFTLPARMWELPKIRVPYFGVRTYNKDPTLLGYYIRVPYYRKLPCISSLPEVLCEVATQMSSELPKGVARKVSPLLQP